MHFYIEYNGHMFKLNQKVQRNFRLEVEDTYFLYKCGDKVLEALPWRTHSGGLNISHYTQVLNFNQDISFNNCSYPITLDTFTFTCPS